MTVRRWRKVWTAEARQEARERAIARWTPERKERARVATLAKADQRKATYAAKYPERAEVYAAAIQNQQPCDCCGGEARPYFNLEPYELKGWRCYVCRKTHPVR